jgi:hypothetical protein
MSNNLDKKSQVYIRTFYVHPPKFDGENTFLVLCVKKRKNWHVNSNFVVHKFVFFYTGYKKCLFLVKLGEWT